MNTKEKKEALNRADESLKALIECLEKIELKHKARMKQIDRQERIANIIMILGVIAIVIIGVCVA